MSAAVDVLAMRVHEAVWLPSENAAAQQLLADSDAVSVTVTYDDGSQIIFRRTDSGRGR